MLLSVHEATVWWEFQQGKTTGEIASEYEGDRIAPAYVYALFQKSDKGSERDGIKKVNLTDTQYVSRVLNRARSKIEKALRNQAKSHRLDIETVQDYKGLLRGFDYQANTEVYIIYTMKLGVIVWYKHDSYAGKLCHECPKEEECRDTLDTIMAEYNITLRPDEEQLYMTQQSIAIFNKLAAKEVPRYKRA
ncbi:MAG: hypothetical protein AM326_01440 [Candidatus Thorarchaeota archaeon SMTZ-45]|nr:MAG: hypothetical protein AM326_01440 [Candidatus Thorarchaeota archaeon SMTZ-45]KXH75163.1 MAG: hypothetical protein AM324_15330 [Candidatus Thorarchaeota archaeon SMTZ1-83]